MDIICAPGEAAFDQLITRFTAATARAKNVGCNGTSTIRSWKTRYRRHFYDKCKLWHAPGIGCTGPSGLAQRLFGSTGS